MPFIKKHARLMGTIVCALVMAISFLYIAHYYYGTWRQRNLDASVRNLYESLEPTPVSVLSPADTTSPSALTLYSPDETDYETALPDVPPNLERMAPFLEINEDFVAMLLIPGLDMMLPVVQGDDDEKYLNVNFEGAKDPRGTVFLDFRNQQNFMDKNNVLYGHYMQDGTMFHNLFKYKNIDQYAQAPIIQIESLYGMTTWLVFAAYTCEPTFHYYHTHFPEGGYESLLSEIKRRSMFVTEIDVTANDRLLTLSTCDYDFEDARFTVHARQLRYGEGLPIRYAAKANTDRQPYNVPYQQRLSAVSANRITALQHPQNSYLYFFQHGEDGIERYVGNFTNVQGPFAAYTGEINTDIAGWVAAGHGYPARREFYLVSGGLNGNERGLYLLRAPNITADFTLASRTPITPAGEDAQRPVLHTDSRGQVSLLYTVAGDELEILYVKPLHGGGDPVAAVIAETGADIRPVGIVEHQTAGTFLFWKEGNRLRARMKTDDVYFMNVEVDYPEEEGRLHFVYQRSMRRWMAVKEQNGKVQTETVDITGIIKLGEQLYAASFSDPVEHIEEEIEIEIEIESEPIEEIEPEEAAEEAVEQALDTEEAVDSAAENEEEPAIISEDEPDDEDVIEIY